MRHRNRGCDTQKQIVAQDAETEAATHTEIEAATHRNRGCDTQKQRLRDTETAATRHRNRGGDVQK